MTSAVVIDVEVARALPDARLLLLAGIATPHEEIACAKVECGDRRRGRRGP